MALGKTLYNTIFKRTSTYALVIAGSALFFERSFDLMTERIFQNINRGNLISTTMTTFLHIHPNIDEPTV